MISTMSCFWHANAKDDGIYCLVREHWLHTTYTMIFYGIHWVPFIQHREWFRQCSNWCFTVFHPCRTLSRISFGVCPSTYYHNRLIFFYLVSTGATTWTMGIWKGAMVSAGPGYKTHCMQCIKYTIFSNHIHNLMQIWSC